MSRRHTSSPPPHPDDPQAARAAGLAQLAVRELSETQVRQRLTRRGFEPGAVEVAIGQLRDERAIDDRRVAAACARTEARIKGRGPARILQHIQAIGIGRELAEEALREAVGRDEEVALLEQALERRLRGTTRASDAATLRRLYAHLVRQGFAPGAVVALLKRRWKRLPDLSGE